MFSYSAFIEELRKLNIKAHTLLDRPQLTEDDGFRLWRHEVTDLIARVESLKYRINCGIAYRSFDVHGSYFAVPTKVQRLAIYNRDLKDTTSEIETLISYFDKYGDPKVDPASAVSILVKPSAGLNESKQLKPPEKVTPAWLWEHASISLWIKGLSILVGCFAAGVVLGESTWWAEISTKVGSTAITASEPLKSLHLDRKK